MLIATRDIDIKALIPFMSEPDKVVSIVESKVPSYLRHHREIIMNQRFYVANLIRGAGSIPINIKLEVCEALLAGITITGTTELYITLEDVMYAVDRDILWLLFEEENEPCGNISSGRGVYSPQNISV